MHRTLLAFASQAQIDQVFERPRERLAAGTVTRAKLLREQLAVIARIQALMSLPSALMLAAAGACPDSRGATSRGEQRSGRREV